MPKSSMPIHEVDKLSPDGFSRFFMLVDILQQVYGDSKQTVRILDVGGGSEFFEQQLTKVGLPYDLTVLDIIKKPARLQAKYIQADATAMDLPDAAYNVVVSTDVMEHIPQPKKQAFLDECLRVSRDVCIIAAPFDTEAVNSAEIAVNEFNKKLFGSGQDWLEEHLELGKPAIKMFTNTMAKANIPYVTFGTQNIFTWILNTHANLIDAKLGLDAGEHVAINQFYNQNIWQMNEASGPTYRQFFVMFKDPALQKDFDVERYTAPRHDDDKIANYWSRLIGLFADKIAEQKSAIAAEVARFDKQSQQIVTLRNDYDSRIIQMQRTIDNQSQTLQKIKPLLRIIHSAPITKARTLIDKRKTGRV